MADLKDIEISVEVDILQAQKAFKAITRDQKALEKAHNSGKITAQQYSIATNALESRQKALTEAVKRGGKEFSIYNNRLNQAKSGTNRFGMISQQVGYQVGDFFVQVQSGTSALVAFGQQGTQLAGLIPGIGGAIVGIGLAIGTMVLRTRQQMEEAENSLMSYGKAVKDLGKEFGELALQIDMLNAGFTEEADYAIFKKIEELKELRNELQRGAAPDPSDLGPYGQYYQGSSEEMAEEIIKNTDALIKSEEERLEKSKNARFRAKVLQAEERLEESNNLKKSKLYYDSLIDLQKSYFNEYFRLSIEQKNIQDAQSNNFDILMAQDLVQRRKYEQETIEFTETMQKLAQQLAFKGGMEQMAKGYDPRQELFEKQNKEAEDRIKLLEIELDYGQDSLELETAILQQERWRKIEAARKAKLSEGMIHDLDMQWTREMNLLLLARKQREEKEKLLELEQERAEFEKKIEGFLESGFMSMIDGTKSVTDAFRSMATDVIKELYRILVVQQIVNQAKTAITSLSGYVFPSANGNAFNNGKIIPYANGGVVGSPTMFPMSGGNTGLMGEAGPEAILPLKRGPDGKLGVESSGGSVVVNQTINVSTGVAQTVRNEIKTLMPQIAEGAKSAVLDAKRRGGSFGSAFA